MWQVHLGIIHFNNEFYARSKCQRRMFNCCQKWGFLSRSAAHCSTAALQQPDLGACTTQTQSGDNSPRQAFVCCTHPRPRPIPCSEPSVVGSCLIKHLSLSSVSSLKTRQNSVIILVSVLSVDNIVSIQGVMRHRTVNISYTVLRKIIQHHDGVWRRFKWFGINWDGVQVLMTARIRLTTRAHVSIYSTSPPHNENVKCSTIAKDPRTGSFSSCIYSCRSILNKMSVESKNSLAVCGMLMNWVSRMQMFNFQFTNLKSQRMTWQDGK